MAVSSVFDVMLRKLERLGPMTEEDRAAVRTLSFSTVAATAGTYLVRSGQRTDRCCLLLDGYACRHKRAGDGARQIVSFHLPGDLLDLQQLLLDEADHNIQMITAGSVAWVASAALRTLSDRPNLGKALWHDTLIDASIFREWVLNVGRRDAKSRVAHMLCEFAVRRAAAGLGEPEQFELPMSQEQIADATGLTTIHVNRMLRALAEDGAIEREKRRVTIRDWARMRRIADFDPAYLHEAA